MKRQAMKRHDYKIVQRGGIYCPCCSCGRPTESKALIGRRDRRRNKNNFRKLVTHDLTS